MDTLRNKLKPWLFVLVCLPIVGCVIAAEGIFFRPKISPNRLKLWVSGWSLMKMTTMC